VCRAKESDIRVKWESVAASSSQSGWTRRGSGWGRMCPRHGGEIVSMTVELKDGTRHTITPEKEAE
jgi:hypothetical protein